MIRKNSSKPVFVKKMDIGLVILIAAIAVSLLIVATVKGRGEMHRPHLEIRIGSRVYGTYDLKEDQTIRIGKTNVCEIRNGEVRMTEADCPDQICVHSAAISRKGGSIVCLPNHIVLRVIDVEEAVREVDSIAE